MSALPVDQPPAGAEPLLWPLRIFLVAALVAFTGLFWQAREHRLADPLDQAARGAITSGSAQSFLAAPRLRAALTAVAAEAPADAAVMSLSLSPAKFSATLVRPDGSELVALVDPALAATVRPATNASERRGMAFSAVPVDVPLQLLADSERKLGLHPQDLEQLSLYVIDTPGQQPYWHADYLRPALHHDAVAALDGSDVRRLGDPDAALRATRREAASR